jgi:hypothetical protein
MKQRLEEDSGSKALIEKLLVGTLLNAPWDYMELSATEKEWADKSFVWVSGASQSVKLNEPILVRAAKDAYGKGWDPVNWLVTRMSNLSSAQQGFDFEQIAARQVAAALKDGRLPIKDENGNIHSVEKAPDAQTAMTAVASDGMTLVEFLQCPQTTTMFLPANGDGPDVVFWVLCSDEKWYVVLIQAKYYSTKICGNKTIRAAETVSKPLPQSVPDGVSALRIFFPFMGASCGSNAELLRDRVDADGMYMYLDCQNGGKLVLGEDLCATLIRNKKKRKGAPVDPVV